MAPPAEITEFFTLENEFSCTTVDNKLYTISVHKKSTALLPELSTVFLLVPEVGSTGQDIPPSAAPPITVMSGYRFQSLPEVASPHYIITIEPDEKQQ